MKRKTIFFVICILLLSILENIFIVPVQAIPNNNPALKELKSNIGELNPKFDYLTVDYSIVVPEEIENIEITAIPEEKTSKVEISGNENLVLGLNTIKIDVTAEDGTSRTYTIRVTKGNVQKANTNLKSLVIENYELIPEFSNSVTEYILPIEKDVKSLQVDAIPESDKATVKITGQENISGNDELISVLVTAEDGITKKQYNIIATKGETEIQEENENKQAIEENITSKQDYWFAKYVIFSVILIIVLIIALRILQIKRNKIKENGDGEN